MCPEYRSRSWVFSPLPSPALSLPILSQGDGGAFIPWANQLRTSGEQGAHFPSLGHAKGHINHSFTTHQFPSVTNYVYKGLKIDVSSRNMSVWHLCQPGTAQGHKSAVSTRLILLYLNFGLSFTWLCVHGTGISLSDNISYTLFISLFVLPVHPFSVTAKVWTCPRTRFLHHSPI